ncbi:hypothetical protein XENTR_v10002977 [Xenopus tropicalis]|nr:hypothetical protein XENTR_v10002977 [Xenopus tropicalis]
MFYKVSIATCRLNVYRSCLALAHKYFSVSQNISFIQNGYVTVFPASHCIGLMGKYGYTCDFNENNGVSFTLLTSFSLFPRPTMPVKITFCPVSLVGGAVIPSNIFFFLPMGLCFLNIR